MAPRAKTQTRPYNRRQPAPATPAGFYDPSEGQASAPTPASTAEHVAATARQADPVSPGLTTDRAQLAQEIDRIRQIRRPLGAYTQKLALDVRPGYHRHWFNDQPGRIDEALSNGWAHVTGKDGKPLSRVVGSGRDNGALRAYAMEIPEVFWLEDMQHRHEAATAQIEAIKANPFRARQGEAKAADAGKFYNPEEQAPPLQVVKG